MKPQRPYKRTDRVKEQILEIITDTATKHIDIKQFGFITFTKINLTSDLRSATISFSILNATEKIQIIEDKLNKMSGGFKKYIGMEMRLKNIPDVNFSYDYSMDYAEKMNKIIKNINIPPIVDDS